jgi:hypothetical protein
LYLSVDNKYISKIQIRRGGLRSIEGEPSEKISFLGDFGPMTHSQIFKPKPHSDVVAIRGGVSQSQPFSPKNGTFS